MGLDSYGSFDMYGNSQDDSYGMVGFRYFIYGLESVFLRLQKGKIRGLLPLKSVRSHSD